MSTLLSSVSCLSYSCANSIANKSIETQSPPGQQLPGRQVAKKGVVGPVVGGVIGGLILLCAIALCVSLRRRKAARRFSSTNTVTYDTVIESEAVPYDYNPYIKTSQNSVAQTLLQGAPIAPAVVPGLGGIIPSAKVIEAAEHLAQKMHPPDLPSSPSNDTIPVLPSGPNSNTTPIARIEPPINPPATSAAVHVPSVDVAGLLVEVEYLRGVVDQMEAPPGYQDVRAQNPEH